MQRKSQSSRLCACVFVRYRHYPDNEIGDLLPIKLFHILHRRAEWTFCVTSLGTWATWKRRTSKGRDGSEEGSQGKIISFIGTVSTNSAIQTNSLSNIFVEASYHANVILKAFPPSLLREATTWIFQYRKSRNTAELCISLTLLWVTPMTISIMWETVLSFECIHWISYLTSIHKCYDLLLSSSKIFHSS